MPEQLGIAAVRPRLPAQRYVMNNALVMEQCSAQQVTLLDMDTCRRTKVSAQTYQLVLRFSAAGTAKDILGDAYGSQLDPILDALLARGLLQDASAPPVLPVRRRTNVAYRFCNSVAWNAQTSSDFVVVGAPYDMVGELECRLAPAHVRQKSLDYPYRLDIQSAEPLGWFDGATGSWILRGASMADAGDIAVDHSVAAADAETAIIAVLDELCAHGAVPVVLGGDVTSAEATRAWCARRAATTTVIVGAGSNAPGLATPGPQVAGWIHSGALFAADLPEALRSRLPVGSAVLLSIDAAVIHACYLSGPTLTGILRLDVARALIAAVGRDCRIVAIHLSGWAAGAAASEVTSAAACDLLLHAMDAARPVRRA